MMKSRLNTIKKCTIHFLYTGCLIGGLLFSLNTIKQYLSLSTSFHTSKEPLAIEDVPVISICYERGKSPIIKGWMNSKLSSSSELSITDILLGPYLSSKRCWKIMLSLKENLDSKKAVADQLFHSNAHLFFLSIDLPKRQQSERVEYEMFLTSKENFYGIGNERGFWSDGKVATGVFEAGYKYDVTITNVFLTRYIQHCSKDFFYKILTEEYIAANLTKYRPSYGLQLADGTRQNRKCHYKELCLPISLPSEIPLCNVSTPELENMIHNCHYKALNIIEHAVRMQKIQNKEGKVCSMLEHEYVTTGTYKMEKDQKLLLKFKIRAPTMTNRDWSIYIDKTVNQEYYIMDGITFVGIIGGTMGLFVGLSFMDINSRIVKLIFKVLEVITQKKAKSQSNVI